MPSEPKSAREAAAALLSNRAYSSGNMYEKLIGKGYSENESADAVKRLTELGYLDDSAYALGVIRSQRAKGYGPNRILLYLQERGIPREIAEDALNIDNEVSANSTTKAIDAYLRKHAKNDTDAPGPAERQKLAAALARRGFDYSDIRAGLERL